MYFSGEINKLKKKHLDFLFVAIYNNKYTILWSFLAAIIRGDGPL